MEAHQQAGAARSEAVRQRGREIASTPPSAPSRNTSLLTARCYDKRKDLDLLPAGRSSARSRPKGQELDDHYFGTIKPRVAAFMEDLNEELWKLGVLAKTEHNEVAPGAARAGPDLHHDQHRHRPQPADDGDHAEGCRAGTVWSACCMKSPLRASTAAASTTTGRLSTDTGVNLLEPGETPYENAQFLLFLCAVIKAVDDYQDLLRISRGHARATTTVWAPTRRRRPLCRCSWADELTAILRRHRKR